MGTRKLMVVCGWFLCTVGFAAGGLIVFGFSGKYNLRKQAVSYAAKRNASELTVSAEAVEMDAGTDWQEGWLRYEGRSYRYNEDILTFLFMGIDTEAGGETSEGYAAGGQTDTLFVLVLDPHEEAIKLIPINRNTITAVEIYNEQGVHEDTITAQICVQYGFGDGGKRSCEYQVKAVSNLFYGIPINGYFAVNMDVVSEVAELVNGIDIKLLDSGAELSADGGLAGQSQFLTEFIGKAREMAGKDITAPVRIYHQISDRIITDITADEVTYLAMLTGGYRFDAEEVILIPGVSVRGEENDDNDYDEFYADEDALYELLLDVFYEPID